MRGISIQSGVPVFLPVFALFFSGCLSFSTMHPAEPLRPGRAAFLLAAGYEALNVEIETIDEESGEVKDDVLKISLPVIEYGFRYGVIRDLEVGVKSSLFGSTMGDVKYRVLKSGPFTASAGFGLGYADVVLSSDDDESSFASSVYEMHVPFYTSYAVNKKFYLYGTPRYVYRTGGGNSSSAGGLSLGTIFGNSTGILLEYSAFKVLGAENVVQQVMAGLVFGFDNYHTDRFKTDD